MFSGTRRLVRVDLNVSLVHYRIYLDNPFKYSKEVTLALYSVITVLNSA
jgi:hypothetical protein